MASTYVNDLRLNEMATGDGSGTWGTTTNTNLELIAEAFSYGTEVITTNADTHTTTIADGATDPGRSLYLKYTGTLDSACTITIGPNTVSKVWIIENGTSGSQDIILSQGSGANITIPAGDTKVVYSDGAGAGAAFFDAFASLSVVDLTATGIVTAAGTSVFTNLDISGDIDVDGTTNLDVVDVDGAVNFAADVTFADGADIITASAGTSNFRAGVNAGNSIESGGNYNTVVGDEAGTAITTGDGNVAVGYGSLDANTTGGQSTAVGYNALGSSNYNGVPFNVAVGYGAGQAATTAYNLALVGYNAGAAITTGGNLTALGSSALLANTEGIQNVAMGTNTLRANTTGSYNTGLGDNALITSITASNNTAVGYAALNLNTAGGNTAVGNNAMAANTTGGYSVAVGFQALDASVSANHNTAVGYQALTATTAGSNTAVGGNALGANTTANSNTAVGYNSLGVNTTGASNTAVGTLALDANTTASNNTAVGASALTANTAGGNTAVGASAGTAITTGADNTFVGEAAGDATDNGANNVAVGKSALSANCGNNNVAIGSGALQAATGEDNTAVGYFAMGETNVSGAANTSLGYAAGYALTTGSGNLFLGKDAGRTGSPGGNITSGSNAIVLGDENIGDAHIQVDWTVASDARDKTDFTALDLGLDFVKALAPVTYRWDKRSKYGDKTAEDYDLNAQTPDGTHKEDWLDIGFKAQEVEALEIAAGYTKDNNTNLVSSHTSDGKQMGLQYSKFVPILVKALQEADAKIEALTTRIIALEG
jgi:trimeric autotransporter adhesin